MAAPADNLHSRIVGWLKIILPLSALALLSTLFLVAQRGGERGDVPFSERDLQEMANDQRLDGPDFSGVTDEGRLVEVSARVATPRGGNPNIIDAVSVHGRMYGDGTDAVDVVSDTGTVYTTESRTVLNGNVRITTTTGYTMLTDELTAQMDTYDMETTGPVSANGPIGQIDAGRMALTNDVERGGTPSVVFKDGVKLIYLPKNQ